MTAIRTLRLLPMLACLSVVAGCMTNNCNVKDACRFTTPAPTPAPAAGT